MSAPSAPTSSGRTRWPDVCAVMPAVNESRHLAHAVHSILDQDYPGRLDVVVAVGPSRDDTRAVADGLGAESSRVLVVDNPTGRTPAGLNAAIAATSHPVIVRVDAHGVLPADYVRTAVEVLESSGADNVGGLMAPEGTTPFESAVAWAMSSRWGIGDARFHVGGQAGEVDTVYLGTFTREVLQRLGGFDEGFVRAQDWELNHRIRLAGGRVWFSPDLRVTYRPRATPRALLHQFFTTGAWRFQVIRRYPETANVRYLTPPTVVVVLGAGTVVGLVGAVVGPPVLTVALLAPASYAAGVLGVTLVAARGLPAPARLRLPLVLCTMHLAWGAGFLREALGGRRSRG